MIRAFIAVDLPAAVRQEVGSLQSELRTSGADIKWVGVENLHLTLKFLGDIEENQVQTLTEALHPIMGTTALFALQLEGVGAFPKMTSPRVLWVGVTDGQQETVRLAQTVEQTCTQLGFPSEDKPFSPHLTIGRVRSLRQVGSLIKRLE